ncbi:hypothetical protein AQUCO_01300061v1 [Aquilegia coerulea]|uniref:K Homology domain-containing protein n=1 Tax=Aquilegia coerulea TaxID=218851 RepID=A0A2G5DZK2_AQUCA|nr:hypothetical protein AQUCO_01300061v1 [Aquilegia coerulea]
MERSRSKRKYYYDQDYDSQNLGGRNKPRYNNSHHRRGGGGMGGGGGRFNKHQQQDSSNSVSVSYRILCHDIRAGGVIGKSGSIIKSIRQETGAWINVHQLIPGDEERVIEITDVQRRDADRRVPPFSPAQEALFMIHERIIESDAGFGFGFHGGDDDEDYGLRGGGSRVATRLVVAKANVGCLLGKGGKIIEQMRIETKTQIRVLPRDHTLPQCVAMSEEVVQVVGHIDAVKRALVIISSRLRESQLRDRSQFQGRAHSPERFFPDDEFAPHLNNTPRGLEGPSFSLQPPPALTNVRTDYNTSRSSGHAFESKTIGMGNHAQPFSGQDIVFRILCPSEKIDKVMGETDGIIELLRNDVGVDVRIMDRDPGLDERILIISSDEDPDDDLFPAQEALLHIQTRIVDLDPEKDNIITTRLLVPSSEIEYLKRQDGSLSEMNKLTGANIQILPSEEFPLGVVGADELVQIVGEIRTARVALVELTSRLRDYLFREVSFSKDFPQVSDTPDNSGGMFTVEAGSPNKSPAAGYRSAQTAAPSWPSKDAGVSGSNSVEQRDNDGLEDTSSGLNRFSAPLVTRSTLEVVIPEYAITKLIMGSKNKLAQISELAGASIVLVEDNPEQTQKIIKISGTPEQAERAQSLLQGFILSTQEDAPS